MKTQLFLTIAIMAFYLNPAFADNLPEVSVNAPVSKAMINLAPAAPMYADFSDIAPESAPSAVSLIPVAPKEASFDDESAGMSIDTLNTLLVPTTPEEADFEDNSTSFTESLSLNPITPVEAGFEETV
jgi:hypothetical protein